MTTITIDRALLEQALALLSAPNHRIFSEPKICLNLRAALSAPATAPERPINCGTGHCSCIECVMPGGPIFQDKP